ncbi:uncharacterized protein METZ01_LOCUS419052, partial [marine metagenome]
MDKLLVEDLSIQIIEIIKKASDSVMEIYLRKEIIQKTKEDGSPLTEADLTSHKVISEGLNFLPQRFPVLSEEGNRRFNEKIKVFWLVDPLDGTKEFIKKTGEFTINIALIEGGKPILGIVSSPVTGELFIGILGKGAYRIKKGVSKRISTKNLRKDILRITLSRSHQSIKDKNFIKLADKKFKEIKITPAGSSLKLCRVAEGRADIYCRLGPTFQWDIASGHAVL